MQQFPLIANRRAESVHALRDAAAAAARCKMNSTRPTWTTRSPGLGPPALPAAAAMNARGSGELIRDGWRCSPSVDLDGARSMRTPDQLAHHPAVPFSAGARWLRAGAPVRRRAAAGYRWAGPSRSGTGYSLPRARSYGPDPRPPAALRGERTPSRARAAWPKGSETGTGVRMMAGGKRGGREGVRMREPDTHPL